MDRAGSCRAMCPHGEQHERIKTGQLSEFENGRDLPLVKRYTRSYAGAEVNVSDLRPVSVLQQTVEHLITKVLNLTSNNSYGFISDRLRAVRKDAGAQGQTAYTLPCCALLLAAVRYHCLASYLHAGVYAGGGAGEAVAALAATPRNDEASSSFNHKHNDERLADYLGFAAAIAESRLACECNLDGAGSGDDASGRDVAAHHQLSRHDSQQHARRNERASQQNRFKPAQDECCMHATMRMYREVQAYRLVLSMSAASQADSMELLMQSELSLSDVQHAASQNTCALGQHCEECRRSNAASQQHKQVAEPAAPGTEATYSAVWEPLAAATAIAAAWHAGRWHHFLRLVRALPYTAATPSSTAANAAESGNYTPHCPSPAFFLRCLLHRYLPTARVNLLAALNDALPARTAVALPIPVDTVAAWLCLHPPAHQHGSAVANGQTESGGDDAAQPPWFRAAKLCSQLRMVVRDTSAQAAPIATTTGSSKPSTDPKCALAAVVSASAATGGMNATALHATLNSWRSAAAAAGELGAGSGVDAAGSNEHGPRSAGIAGPLSPSHIEPPAIVVDLNKSQPLRESIDKASPAAVPSAGVDVDLRVLVALTPVREDDQVGLPSRPEWPRMILDGLINS